MYDVGALSLLIAAGLTLMTTGVLAAGWKHKFLIWGLIVAGGAIIVLGAAWPFVKWLSPWLARQFALMGSSPSAWFTLIMFIIAVALFGRNGPPKFKTARNQDYYKELSNIRAEMTAKDDRVNMAVVSLNSDISGKLQSLLLAMSATQKEIRAQIDALRDQMTSMESRVQFPPNLGDTLGEALRSAEDVRLGQIARIRDEIEPLKERLAVWDREIGTLLSWANARVARTAFMQLALQIPELDEGKPSDDPGQRRQAINEAARYVGRVRSATESMQLSYELSAVLEQAEQQAEQTLRNIDTPNGMHALDFKDYYVAIYKAKRVAKFLEDQSWKGDFEEGGNYQSVLQRYIIDRNINRG